MSQVSYEPGPPTGLLFCFFLLRTASPGSTERQLTIAPLSWILQKGGAMLALVWRFSTSAGFGKRRQTSTEHLKYSRFTSGLISTDFKHYEKEMTASASCLCVGGPDVCI